MLTESHRPRVNNNLACKENSINTRETTSNKTSTLPVPVRISLTVVAFFGGTHAMRCAPSCRGGCSRLCPPDVQFAFRNGSRGLLITGYGAPPRPAGRTQALLTECAGPLHAYCGRTAALRCPRAALPCSALHRNASQCAAVEAPPHTPNPHSCPFFCT